MNLKFLKHFFEWDGLTRGQGGFIQAALVAAPYILNALGGVFGKKKKYLNPEVMQQKYGSRAVAKETQDIANFILNSPYGQQLLAGAAESGQNLQTEMDARAAQSGLSPDTGASSGASTFATSAGAQAQGNLERQTKAGIWQAALPIAQQQVAQRAALEQSNLADQNAQPSLFQKIAAASGQLAQSNPFQPKTKKPGDEEV